MNFYCHVKLIILVITLLCTAFSMAGRVKPPKKIYQIYATDKPQRTIAFMTFDNLNKSKTNIYGEIDIPKNIAFGLRYIKTIQIGPGDVIPTFHNLNMYQTRVFKQPFNRKVQITTNIFKIDENKKKLKKPAIITNIDPSTNVFFSDLITNEAFVFSTTNEVNGKKEVTSYSKNSNTLYNDPHLAGFSLDDIKSNQQLMTNYKKSGKPSKFVLQETNHFIRKFVVINSIHKSSYLNLSEILNQVKADYILFGNFYLSKNNLMKLKIYLINTHTRGLEMIFNKNIMPENLYEEISIVPHIILATIQHKRMIKSVAFHSRPRGAYIYLDNKFIGTTPFTQKLFPEGNYDFNLWYPGGEIDFSKSFDTHSASNSMVRKGFLLKKDNKWVIKKILYFRNLEHTTNFFFIKKKPGMGKLHLSLEKNSNANIYLNSKLIGFFSCELSFVCLKIR